MKILITFAVIAFGAIFTNNEVPVTALSPASPSLLSKPEAIIKVKLRFGKKSSGCTRTGVCSFESDGPIDIDISVVEPNSARGTATMSDGKLVVNLLKSSMSRDVMTKHFADNKFVVEEAYKIELENTLVSSYIIRKNTYEVMDNGKFLTVEF
ncbi:MAG: hypothetical protein U0X91_07965 [Spirosomataceae bacterium]